MKATSKLKNWQKYLVGTVVLAVVFVAGFTFGGGQLFQSSTIPQNAQLPSKLDYSSVNAVYQELKQNYDGKLTTKQLLDGLKHGLARATGDPHTEYFTAQEASQFNKQLNNKITGIGAELGENSDGNLQIVSPIKGFPADRAGVQAGDAIASVDGESTNGWSLTKAVSKIRGKKGTKVKLGLVRDSKFINITITRDSIEVPSVTWKVIDGNIGYISVISFGDDTSSLSKKAAKKLKQQGVDSIILDLRSNPGGLLDAAIDLSSLWVDEGQLVLQEKKGDKIIDTYYARGDNILKGLPTVVLINQGSASASEITAGALRDHNAATLIGMKSYGKGTVQGLKDLLDGAKLKVTVAKWYRSNGKNIDEKGIKPDKKIKLSDSDIKHGRDPQLKAAKKLLQQK